MWTLEYGDFKFNDAVYRLFCESIVDSGFGNKTFGRTRSRQESAGIDPTAAQFFVYLSPSSTIMRHLHTFSANA